MLKRALPFASLAILSACSVYDGMKTMEKNTAEMNETTRAMYQTTREMKDSTFAMQEKTSQMSADTQIMRRATESMAATTGDMHKETTGLKEISTELDRQTGDLYQDARQGAALELRLSILDHMNQAKKQFAKIKYANFYFKSLEFQLWKGAGRDDEERLNHLRLDAVQEVIQTFDELAPEGSRSLSPLSNDNRRLNLYALSAALHVLNYDGKLPDKNVPDINRETDGNSFAAQDSHEPTGVLKLFYDALLAKKSLDDGSLAPSDLKAYQASVLKFEELATYILKLRVNFLTAIAVKQLAAADGESLDLMKRLAMWLKPWQAYTENRNTVQLSYYGWVLGEAQATRDTLKTLGIETPLDPTLGRVISHIKFAPENKSSSAERHRAVRDIHDRLTDLSHGTER